MAAGRWRRVLWFLGLWAASVATPGAVAWVIRAMIGVE
jgi:hypothetical protein